jgi:hypothetical protein
MVHRQHTLTLKRLVVQPGRSRMITSIESKQERTGYGRKIGNHNPPLLTRKGFVTTRDITLR